MITIFNPKCGGPEETQTERDQHDAPPIKAEVGNLYKNTFSPYLLKTVTMS